MHAKFATLDPEAHYDIISSESGSWITRGIQGVDALSTTWEEGDEAWPVRTPGRRTRAPGPELAVCRPDTAGTTFSWESNDPVDVAE